MNARDIGEYLAEFVPTNGTPGAPCALCGDTVFYQLNGTPWRYRSCHPPAYTGWRTVGCHHRPQCELPEHIRSAICRWFVAP